MAGKVRVYIGTSLDGLIAGPNDELDWLPHPTPDFRLPPGALGFEAFLAEVGVMVMGRRTYDVVRGLSPDWYYGDTHVWVPTTRPLESGLATVKAVSGSIETLLDEALAAAGGKDVYVDGGATIRSALEVDRVDELVITVVPVILGAGRSLFAGLGRRVPLEVTAVVDYGLGMHQIHARPRR
jgi:dihydrofolate reductase